MQVIDHPSTVTLYVAWTATYTCVELTLYRQQLETLSRRQHATCTTARTKHVPQVLDDCVWALPSGKVAALGILALVHDRAHSVPPRLGQRRNLLGKTHHAKLDVWYPHSNAISQLLRIVRRLVVDATSRSGTGPREDVDGYSCEDLIVGPWEVVSPTEGRPRQRNPTQTRMLVRTRQSCNFSHIHANSATGESACA